MITGMSINCKMIPGIALVNPDVMKAVKPKLTFDVALKMTITSPQTTLPTNILSMSDL